MKLWYTYPQLILFDKDVTENQHAVKVFTQKGICGTVLTVQYLLEKQNKKTVQYLPSGEHKNYDNVLTSNSTK